MSKQKLTPDERRALVLAALSGVPVLQLSKEYGVARSWIYVLISEATSRPYERIAEATEELEFRYRVLREMTEDHQKL